MNEELKNKKWTKSNVPGYSEVNNNGDSRVEILSTFTYSDVDGYIGQTHKIIIDGNTVDTITLDDTNSSDDSFSSKLIWNDWVATLED